MRIQETNHIIEFMRRETSIRRDMQIMQPEFGLLIARADMNVSRFSAFIGIKESTIRPPA